MAKIPRLLILVVALSLLLRLINLNQSFWLDEASQAQMSVMPLQFIWSQRGGDFHPPLFYVLSHLWLQVNTSEVWARLLPVTFGVLNVFLIYYLAKQIWPDKFLFKSKNIDYATLTAFFLAINPFHIYYSQEFRAYSLLCLLGTWSMFLFYQKKFYWLSIANALLLYTHYSSVFLILAQIIFSLLRFPKNRKAMLLSVSLTMIFYLPWLPHFISQISSGINIDQYLPGWRQVLSVSPLKAFPVTMFKLIAGRINFLNRWLYGLYIVFVFAVTFSSLLFSQRAKQFLLNWSFTPIFIMLIVSVALPQNQPFRVIFVLPALILLFTQACFRFPKLFITLMIYICLVGNLAYFTRPRLQREHWRQAISFLSQESQPVVVKFSDKFAPFYWYNPDLKVYAAVPTFPSRVDQVSQQLAPLSNSPSLLVLEYLQDLTDPSGNVDLILTQLGYKQTNTYDFPGVGFIQKYEKI